MCLSSILWRCLPVLLLASSGSAATIYSYVGNTFDPSLSSGNPGVGASNFIVASFTVESPLAANLVDSGPTLSSWTISDGVHTFGSAGGEALALWSLWTDGNGNITEWLMTTNQGVFPSIGTENANGLTVDFFTLTSEDLAFVVGAPGVWSSSVPEPGSMALMALGGLLLAAKLSSSRR